MEALALFQGEKPDVELKDGRSQWDHTSFFSTRWHVLRDGEIDFNAIDVFTRGHCHSLAIALQELVGGELVGTQEDCCDGIPSHILVKTGHDTYVDIEGIQDYDEVMAKCTEDAYLAEIHIDEIEDWTDTGDYRPLRVDDARPFAEALAERESLERLKQAA